MLRLNSLRKDYSPCIKGYEHLFVIIKGSGINSNAPFWKCIRCKRKVKSS